MNTEPRYRKSSTVSFALPYDHYNRQRAFSFAESEWDYEPHVSTISPTPLALSKALRVAKPPRKIWDSDNAIKSTYKGLFGKHQLRAYIFLALGYGIILAWLTKMPSFALLSPKYIDCTPYYLNISNLTNQSTKKSNKPIYDYSKEYGRTVVTDFDVVCDKTLLRLPYIAYLIGLILGGLIFGYLADYSGRKMILLGSMWTTCALSVFQLLSDDYISYVFFIFFIGMAIGAVQVITIPYVLEMFQVETRAIYGLSLLGVVFLLDLIIPWLALLIKNWKILQAVVSVPLIITSVLYWFAEESMFWYTSQKDYAEAVSSLTRVAQFNGIVFKDVFHEALDFLHGKRSKGIQCDFQPLLRLEEVKVMTTKYPDFDVVDLQATTGKNTLTKRIIQVITGHHYKSTSTTYYPTDYFHSSILTIYLLVMCGLWLVSSLTEYSLDAPQLTQYLTDSFFDNYFYTQLIQVISFIFVLPMVYKWGRRWPTFFFFLIAEVCLLGSVAVKLDNDQTRTAMLIVYFTGKFAARAAFIVLLIYTCEIFPTGLRCTTLGICYTFRLIGIALASPDIGELNDWMSRLIYGILSLILGAMALLLPETKKNPLPRTFMQIENFSTSISKTFRRRRSAIFKKKLQASAARTEGGNALSDAGSIVSGVRSGRMGLYDNQSTLHSIYELQDFTPDDTIHSMSNRYPPRRMDSRNSLFSQPHIEALRRQQSIAEDVEYDDDVDDDRARLGLQQRLTEKRKQLSTVKELVVAIDEDAITSPVIAKTTSIDERSPTHVPSQLEITAQIQSRDVAVDRNELTTTDETINNNPDENLLRPLEYRREMSQDENYFSEHC